jgi:hypothetical protein
MEVMEKSKDARLNANSLIDHKAMAYVCAP